MSFSHFGELWHRGGSQQKPKHEARWLYNRFDKQQASNEDAVWWDMRLADALVCLSVTLLNGQVCANDFAIKAFEYRNDFGTIE